MRRKDFIWLICGAFGLDEKQVSIENDGIFTLNVKVSGQLIDSDKFHEIANRNIAAAAKVVLINEVGEC